MSNSISPALLSSPDAVDMANLAETKCVSCGAMYFLFSDSDALLCHDCTWLIDTYKPSNEAEVALEKVIEDMTDEELKSVGMGRFFELLKTTPPPAPPKRTTKKPANMPQSMYDAQTAAVNSQIQHERKKSDNDVSHMYDTQMATLNSQLMHERKRSNSHNLSNGLGITGMPATSSIPRHQSHAQGTTTTSSHAMPASSGIGRLTADEYLRYLNNSHRDYITSSATAGHSRTSNNSFAQSSDCGSEILRSPSVEAQGNQAKRKGKRMTCAICGTDAPVSNKNDGVNCTRCFKKLQKTRESVPPSSAQYAGAEKRSYEEAFDGYSQWDKPQHQAVQTSPQAGGETQRYEDPCEGYTPWNSSPSQVVNAAPPARVEQQPYQDLLEGHTPWNRSPSQVVNASAQLGAEKQTFQDPYEGYTQWDSSPSTIGRDKRSYENAFDGYSPWDQSPSKVLKRTQE